MNKPKVRKISVGTYKVTFAPTQSYVVAVPNLYIEMGYSEKELRKLAVEAASEQLPK